MSKRFGASVGFPYVEKAPKVAATPIEVVAAVPEVVDVTPEPVAEEVIEEVKETPQEFAIDTPSDQDEPKQEGWKAKRQKKYGSKEPDQE
jgi:hypothetical protein